MAKEPTVQRISRDKYWFVRSRHHKGQYMVGRGSRQVITVDGINDHEGQQLAQFIANALNDRQRKMQAAAEREDDGE